MRKNNRLRKQQIPFSKEQFYIVSYDQAWQFRDSFTHVAVSTNATLEGLGTCILAVFKRYKDYSNYRHAMDNMSERAVTVKERDRRIQEYERIGHDYDSIVEDMVSTYNNTKGVSLLEKVKREEPIVTERSTPTPKVTTPPKRLPRRTKSRL